MNRYASALRSWLRWRARRARLNVSGIADYVMTGTIVDMNDGRWDISMDQGGHVSIPVAQFTVATNLRIGDRVQVQPLGQAGPPLMPYGWQIVGRADDRAPTSGDE